MNSNGQPRGTNPTVALHSAGIPFDGCESATAWSPTNATAVSSSVWKQTGDRSILVTGSGTNVNADITNNNAFIDLATFTTLSFDINITTTLGTTTPQPVLISIGTTSAFSTYFTASVSLRPGVSREVTVHKNQFTAVGGATWTGYSSAIFIRISAVTGVVSSGYIDNIRINKPLRNKAAIIIGADDDHDDQYDWLFPACQSRGLKLTLYPVKDWVGLANAYTLAQLQEMHTAGVMVCNHSENHFDALGLVEPSYGHAATYAEALANYSAQQTWAIAQGFNLNNEHLYGAYPRGSYNNDVIQACTDLGIRRMRDVRFGYESWVTEPSPSDYHGYNMTPDGTGNAATYAAFQPYIDNLINSRMCGEITFHYLVPGTPVSSNECQQSVATQILDRLAAEVAAGTLESMNPNDLYNVRTANP